MDISKLCTTDPIEEQVEVLPSPQSTHNPYGQKLISIAAITDQHEGVLPPIPDQYSNNPSSNVHLPKIRYPQQQQQQQRNNSDNEQQQLHVNNLSIHDLKQQQPPPSSFIANDLDNHNNSSSKRRNSNNNNNDNNGNNNDSQTPQQSSHYVPNINITDIISQCSRLCENLDRCKVQPQNELDRYGLLQTAAQTARDILSSLGTLHEQQKNRRRHSTINHHDANALVTDTESSETIILRRSRSDSDGSIRPRIKRRAKRSTAGQRCHSCHTTETPEWRRGPDGARTLCNACGLHYAKLLRKGSLTVQKQGFLIDNGVMENNDYHTHHALTNNNGNHVQQRRQPRIIQYPIIQVQAKPEPDAKNANHHRVKFVNSEISYPRDDKWRICHSTSTSTSRSNTIIPPPAEDTSPCITNRIVEVEEE